ncbi:hypothetical protein WISP_67590 [Willisornis vidua]|uniref:Uncharacterized protein n=1 Tax=Willisornis vidua TaxID=1566151 RepID=A0ABQ9DEG8_9PASS|nr:hypothetical protein WISP_67590 [Willisornis vidua]
MDLSMDQYNFQSSLSTHDLVVQQLCVKLKGTEAFSVALRPPQTSWVYCGKRRYACFPWIGWQDCARIMLQGLTWISKQEDWNYPPGSGEMRRDELCQFAIDYTICRRSQPFCVEEMLRADCEKEEESKQGLKG